MVPAGFTQRLDRRAFDLGGTLFDMKGAASAGTIAFLTGAAMFYLILYRGRLVPRGVSVAGTRQSPTGVR